MGKIPSGFEGKMVKIAPGSIGREDNLGVIWKVELLKEFLISYV